MASLKYGLNADGRTIGPVDPGRVRDSGWAWFDRPTERDAAPPPLEVARRRKMAALAEQQATVLGGGFGHAGTTWSADPEAVQNILVLSASINSGNGLPGGGSDIGLLDASDTPVTMTETEVTALAVAGRDFLFEVRGRRLQLAAQIASAADHAALDAIDITAGWPG